MDEKDLAFEADIRMNPYPVVFEPRSPIGMPCAIVSSNQSKQFVVR